MEVREDGDVKGSILAETQRRKLRLPWSRELMAQPSGVRKNQKRGKHYCNCFNEGIELALIGRQSVSRRDFIYGKGLADFIAALVSLIYA